MNFDNTNRGMQGLVGAGIDSPPERRPGVPMEIDPPKPVGHAHWTKPEEQPHTVEVLKRANLDKLTPVFGTAAPPRGLSGMMKRLAYKIPEHRVSHWLLMLLSDRIDVLEHGSGRVLLLPLAGALAFGGAKLFARPKRFRVFQ